MSILETKEELEDRARDWWSDYKVCYVQGYTDEIEECASEWVKKGYEPIGDLIVREGRSKWVFFQAFWKQG